MMSSEYAILVEFGGVESMLPMLGYFISKYVLVYTATPDSTSPLVNDYS